MEQNVQLLSHYTGFEGLVGIVRSQCLRATEFSLMNDTSEFTYALKIVSECATLEFVKNFPDQGIFSNGLPANYASHVATEFTNFMKTTATANGGYGSYFITSFARGKNNDEDERGILTLWDRYTQLKGYCLQFDKNAIQRLVNAEADRYSYELLDMFDVKYGIDQSTPQFRKLIKQLAAFMIESALKEVGRFDLLDQAERPPPLSIFGAELLLYCLRHKDPQFVDEREFRIVASPHSKIIPQPMTGLKFRKDVYGENNSPSHRRYIQFGDRSFPGIRPRRVLLGPKVDLFNSQMLFELWAPRPTVKDCGIPIG